MTRSRLGASGLLARHLIGGGSVSLLLPVLVLIASLSISLAPRALAQVSTAELQHQLSRESPLIRDLVGTGRLGIPLQDPNLGVEYLRGTSDEAIQLLRTTIPEPLLSATGAPVPWVLQTQLVEAELPTVDIAVDLTLSIDLDWEQRAAILAGSAPRAWDPSDGQVAASAGSPPIEVAVSRASAETLGLGIGDLIGYEPAPLEVSAIYEPLDPADSYWLHVAELGSAQLLRQDRGGVSARASVFVAPESFTALKDRFALGGLRAWIVIDPSGMSFADSDETQGQARQLVTRNSGLPFGGSLDFGSSLPDLIEQSIVRVAATSALIALSVSGLVGVLIAVFALGVRSLLARRAVAISLAAARGASELQLRGAMVLEALLLAVPAALLGVAIATLVVPSTEVGPAATLIPATVAVVPAVLVAVLTSGRSRSRRRKDLVGHAGGRARVITELAVAGLAVVALTLLTRRGLVGPSATVGIDPLLSATPLLLAVAACLGVLRLYPLVLRAAQRGIRRRGSATAVVGIARAIRDPALGFTTALALVVGVSVIVFATVMSSTVRAGLVERAAEEVGADIRVTGALVTASTLEALRDLDGVVAAASISTTAEVPFTLSVTERPAIVVVADTVALNAVRPDIPVLVPDGVGVPVLISSDWGDRSIGSSATLGEASVEVAGVIDARSLPGLTQSWVLIDSSAASQLGAAFGDAETALLRVASGVESPLVAAEAHRIVQDAQAPAEGDRLATSDVSTLISEIRTPIVVGLEAALLLAAFASLGLMVLTITLATAAAAYTRNRMLSILRVIGMSTRRLRRVQLWELGPLATVALVVGAALGIALPALVTSVLDLRGFIGGTTVPAAVVEPVAVLLSLAVFALAVVVAASVALALGRRIAPAGILKMGESS